MGNAVANRNYYLGSVFITNIGNGLTFIICGKALYDMSGLTVMFGGILIFEHLKSILLSPVSGVFSTVFSPKKMAIVVDLTLFVCISVFALMSEQGYALVAIPLLLMAVSLSKPFYRTASFALLPQLIDRVMLFRVNAWVAAAQQMGYVIGVAGAAVLMSWLSIGTILAIDGLTYLLSAVLLMRCSLNGVQGSVATESEEPVRAAGRGYLDAVVREVGVYRRLARNHSIVLALAVGFGVQLSLLDIYNVALFKLVADEYTQTPQYLSLLEGVYSVTIIISALVFGRFSVFQFRASAIWVPCGLQAALFFCFSQTTSMWLLVGQVFVLAMCSSLMFTLISTYLQSKMTIENSGSISGLRSFVTACVALPLVGFSSVLMDSVGGRSGYIAMFAISAVLSLYFMRTLNARSVEEYNRLTVSVPTR